MGRRSRDIRLHNEWLTNYAKESTGIIMALLAELAKDGKALPEALTTRIKRLRAAGALWDEIQKNKDKFVP